MSGALLQLAALFAMLSMLAFGGGAGVLPDMQRATVDHYHWLTSREFLDMFAISRAAPGPGSLIVLLIGQKVAGLTGAAVAFVAMFGPSCALVYLVARVWHRAAHAAWPGAGMRAPPNITTVERMPRSLRIVSAFRSSSCSRIGRSSSLQRNSLSA